MKIKILLVITFVFFIASLSAQNFQSSELDAFINEIMEEYKLPGLSIAVVKNDEIIFSKGYGVKKLWKADPVNEHTLFQAASITKTFTAIIIGMLVEEGKLKWNDPVKKFIPEFELSDPYITEHLTIRDLLTFRSGIIGGDTLKANSRKEIISRLKNLRVTNSFRIGELSFNLGYTLAGYIAEQLFGKSYEALVKEKLFQPLGIVESYLDNASAIAATKNYSAPHIIENKKITPTSWEEFGLYAPAVCLISNVIDISKLVRLVLSEGTTEGKTIIKKETIMQMQKPIFIMGDSWKELFNPSADFLTTGLGFVVSNYKGYKLVEMDGAATGTSNTMTMIPSEKIGVIIQTNMDWAFDALVKIKFFIMDKFLSMK